MPEKITIPLTIFLIKDGILVKDILKADSWLLSKRIWSVWTLYYKNSNTKTPKWLELFREFDIQNIFSSTASAVLIVKESDRFFAITFWFGKSILNPVIFEEKFWLKTVLWCVDPDKIRSIDSKALESELMMTRKQSAKATETLNFWIDIDKDFLSSATWVPKDTEKYWKIMSWNDALHVTLTLSLTDIKSYLKNFFECYNSKKYMENFSWIDQMSEVSDKSILSNLDDRLIEEINKNNVENIFLTIPEIIERNDIAWYKFSVKDDHEIFNDLDIDMFKNYLDKEHIVFSDLKKNYLYLWQSSTNQEKSHRSIYNCIYAEIEFNEKKYFLSNWKWYKINLELETEIDNFYETIQANSSDITFPKYSNNNEWDYNILLADSNENYICLDKKNINYWWWYSKIEFADVYSKEKKIFHIKRYTGSNSLTYLFNQWLVSWEAFLDSSFRENLNEKIEIEGFKINETTESINSPWNNYEIIFWIIKNDLNIPFFSKLALRNVFKRLNNLKYKVSLKNIDILES